jgi:hypothetical protein
MRYVGNASHPPSHQEVPALFVDRRLGVLSVCSGSSRAWRNASLTFHRPGTTPLYVPVTEPWAAYVTHAAEDAYGIAVFTPIAQQVVAYRVGPDEAGGTNSYHTSYLALLVTAAVRPHTEFWYDTYVAVGCLRDMRSAFARLATNGVRSSVAAAQRHIHNLHEPYLL